MSIPSQFIKHSLFSFSSDLYIPLGVESPSEILTETEDKKNLTSHPVVQGLQVYR